MRWKTKKENKRKIRGDCKNVNARWKKQSGNLERIKEKWGKNKNKCSIWMTGKNEKNRGGKDWIRRNA